MNLTNLACLRLVMARKASICFGYGSDVMLVAMDSILLKYVQVSS